jgi:transketolase
MNKTNDELCINTLRFLAVDAVQQANSGHPGAPMGAAAPTYVLWDRFLKHHPAEPHWPNRDRFILSAGHASAMLYSLLHLTGYDLPLEEIKRFRQWGSKTPGHPEYGLTPGVEATTGPLGQGFANGVGMAIAERWLAEHYNRPNHEIIDHYIYGLVSDGDLMEGISAEAASMAGHLKLGKIIYIYDDNDISIEGDTAITFTEDVARRFSAYGWHVIDPVDGLNLEAVAAAIVHAQEEKERPSLIITKTVIGYGSPHKAGTASAHGEPLGEDEVRLSKERLGWPYAEPFTVPPEALKHYRQALEKGQQQYRDWQEKLAAYRRAYPKEAARLEGELAGDLPQGWQEGLGDLFKNTDKPIATRAASGQVMNAIAPRVHALMGGSADLSPSNKTILKDKGDFDAGSYGGHNMHFGVREHAMGAIANGMALHGGIIPYTATFLIFYDYMRPPVRLAALSCIRVIFIYTHDSVALGEDGPTHQPIEQLSGLRAVPNLVTLRPADATETAEAWQVALERRNGPTVMALTRQKLPVFNRQELAPASGVRRGGYVLWQSDDQPEVILIATGSEVHIALEAGKLLAQSNISARVVSLPSWELFDDQPLEYRHSVLPPSIKARVSMEAASPMGWERYVGDNGVIIGLDRFGASAPGDIIYQQLGLTAQHMAAEARRLLEKE